MQLVLFFIHFKNKKLEKVAYLCRMPCTADADDIDMSVVDECLLIVVAHNNMTEVTARTLVIIVAVAYLIMLLLLNLSLPLLPPEHSGVK